MAYLKRTWITGSVIEVEKYYTCKYKSKKVSRMPKVNSSSEQMQKVNERNAIKKLRRLVNSNFSKNDMHLILTYEYNKKPETTEAAKKDIAKFLRCLKREYSKKGHELKYISVAEYGKRSVHFHLIISKGLNYDEISAVWGNGRIHVHPLDGSGDYSQLAEYLIKQTRKTFNDPERAIYKKRWSGSKNLIKPEPIIEVAKADSWREVPTAPAGYIVMTDSIYTDVSDITGYPFQYYKCIAINNKIPERMRKKYGKRNKHRKADQSSRKHSCRSDI